MANLNLFAPMNYLGVGTHAYGLASAYEKLGNEICLIPPFGSVGIKNDVISKWLKNRDDFDIKDPSLMIFDTSFLTQFSGSPRIGFAVFETDGFNAFQLRAIRSCDYVLTPSEWGKQILWNHSIKSSVVNEGIDPEAFPVSFDIHDNNRIRFIHVGKYEERKGTSQTIRCFYKALEREDAELILHCENPFMERNGIYAMEQEIFKYGFGIIANGHYTNRGLHIYLSGFQQNMSELYRSADFGIFPTKGEGWGLPIQECIASGTPAIVGCWSGQSEYLGMDYPYALAFERSKFEIAQDNIWYKGDKGSWRTIDDNDLIIKIQWAYENHNFRGSEKWRNTVERIREFTWDKAALQLQEFMKEIK